MGRRIELPQTPSGKAEDQLQQLYSYLYQMAETLNHNLAEIGSNDLTDEEREIINGVTGGGANATGDIAEDRSEAETLKSLIIKTAGFVQNELNQYRVNLLGQYVAEGKFGKYVRNTGLSVDVTPEHIQQNFTFAEIIQGLKTYEINAKNYIKTGWLRTVNNIPIYGVAIGKDIVTFAQDGTETYNDGNKVAELTADELSFWQSGNKVASYTGSKITFYYGQNPALYIENGKIYAAGDLEITSGKKLKIVSGGIIDVDATNFTIDSVNKQVKTDDITLDNHGVTYQNSNGLKIRFGESNNFRDGNNVMCGIYGTLDNVLNIGKMTLMVRPYNDNSNREARIVIESQESESYGMPYRSWIYPDTFARFNFLGKSAQYIEDNRFHFAYINGVIGSHMINTGGPSDASSFDIILDGDFDPVNLEDVPAQRVRFEYVENNSSHPNVVISTLNSTTIEFYNTKVKVGTLYYDNLHQNSSRDIKHDIQPMDSRGEQLDRLRPVTFVYDDDPEEKTRAGLIYEDTVEVMPEICTGDEGNKAINYVELIPMLLKEIQELRARVKALEEGGQ